MQTTTDAIQLLTPINSQCKASNSGSETVSTPVMEGNSGEVISIFLPFRRDKLDAQPEAVLEWMLAQKPQHDGRCYVRTSVLRSQFGSGARAFYHITSELAALGLISVERWRLEQLTPGIPRLGSHASGKMAGTWGVMETLYVFTPISNNVVVSFETYVRHADKFPALHKDLRHALWMEANGRCAYCGVSTPLETFQVDHVIPKSRGGLHRWENLAVACFTCNGAKGACTPAEFAARRRRA